LVTDPESDTITVRLEEEQILNFETWTVPPSNLISIAGPSLIIKNLSLRHEEQSLSVETTEPGDVVITFGDFNLRTPSRLVFSEEETAAGIVNGTVGLDNVLTNLGIQSDLTVDQLRYDSTLLGDIVAEVNSQDEQTYVVEVDLKRAGNNAELSGTVELNGPIDLLLDVRKLQLDAAEPFSLGYLKNSEGFLSGKVDVSGTFDAPRLNGDLRFNEASITISLLGERFRLDEKPIRFRGQTISFGDDWNIYDSKGGGARVQGEVVLQSLDDIVLDLGVKTDNFLAVNSNVEDNRDWFGEMYVDATVEISGTAVRPVVDVVATTSRESAITYVYRIAQQGLVETEGMMDFAQAYQWPQYLRGTDTLALDSTVTAAAGMDLTLDLEVDPNLEVTVVVDPVTGQTFVGRADGDLSMRIYPDGTQEATGRVELTEGKYDFIYQNIINKEFQVLAGSNVQFTGDLINPQLDLRIRHLAETSPLPLVQGVQGEGVDVSGLRRTQTFYVDVTLKGDLQASNITTDVVYPEDAYGNLGFSSVESALATLRQDQSRMTTTAFQLLAFGSFNVPLIDSGGGGGNLVATTLNNALSGYLNNFADQLVGFVDLDFGLDSYQDEGGETQTNLRVSLRKALFDERVIISVDGVAGTAEDELAGTQQTYLDNITAEYLINEDGTFRLKFFNDRDRNTLVGGNVIRFGGRLTFGKDFDRLRWFGKNDDGEE
ncbi:MAG: translocation/assembly module TamB domain-containing protein, partial [Bacteroidota bacterium]